MSSANHLEFEEFYRALEKWLELRAYPYEDGVAVYFRDVSERRRSQEQMLLKTSVAHLNDIVLITEAGSLDAPGPRIVFSRTRLNGKLDFATTRCWARRRGCFKAHLRSGPSWTASAQR